MVTQLVKKLPTFYGTRRFITVFTTAHHWSPSKCMKQEKRQEQMKRKEESRSVITVNTSVRNAVFIPRCYECNYILFLSLGAHNLKYPYFV